MWSLAKQIFDSTDDQLRDRLKEVGPTSDEWHGIIAEMQYRATKGMAKQTNALIFVSWVIVALTFALLLYSIKTDQHLRLNTKAKAAQQEANAK